MGGEFHAILNMLQITKKRTWKWIKGTTNSSSTQKYVSQRLVSQI